MSRSAAVICLVGTATACSGGHAKSQQPLPTTTSTTLSLTAINVDKKVNAGGFVVNLMTAELTGPQALLKIQAQVTNTLPSPQEFNPILTVTSGGTTYDGQAARNPTVSAGASVPVELDVGVDPTFKISDAVIIFGNTTKNQATVPLGATGRYVPLLDVAATPPAPVTAGDQTFTFTKAVVSAYRYDGTELDTGTQELILTVSVKNADPQYSYAVDGSDFKFTNGTETLSSSVVKFLSANAGGTVDSARVYADVDNYKPGPITLTIVGTDRQQNTVRQTTTVNLPPLG